MFGELDQLKQVDPIDGWVLLIIVVVLLAVFEAGRWLAKRRPQAEAARQLHAANVLTGMLTLLSFFLAFSFSLAANHFEQRRQIVLDEANAIGTTYLRSKYLPQPQSDDIQRLLLEYVNLRITGDQTLDFQQLRVRSEGLQQQIWAEAASLEKLNPNSEFAGLFIVSLNQMIDLHESRVTVAFEYRLPLIIMLNLYVISALTLLVMGYSAGLRNAKDALLTFCVILAIGSVLVLIIDLDRPVQRTFTVSQQALIDTREALESDLAR